MRADIAARLARGEESVSVLQEYARRFTTLDPYQADARARDVVERNVQIAVQALIDLGDDLISLRGWGRPATAPAAFSVLAQRGVLSRSLADSLRRWIRLRNVLVHEYATIDSRRVHQALRTRLRFLRSGLLALARAHRLR